jgi:hypothetical protein
MCKWLLPILCIAASIPPLPKAPHRSAAVTQGMGAAKLIAKVVAPSAPRTNSFAWKYPDGMNPAAFWWDIQTAPNAAGPWTVLITNASGVCEVSVNRNEALRLYRLSAKVSP